MSFPNQGRADDGNATEDLEIFLDAAATRDDTGEAITETERLYFEAIDQLYSVGINQEIPLPKLVVIGDQSSGKSSLLESISGLHFPTKATLCTRFATQVIMRNTATDVTFIEASVIRKKKPGRAAQVRNILQRQVYQRTVDTASFLLLFRKAFEAMELAEDHFDINANNTFSEDILSIKISGQDQQNLILLDVPGFYHSGMGGQNVEDALVVKKIAGQHIADPGATIITVMTAVQNSSTADCFEFAKTYDKGRKRTIGVITKCDISNGELAAPAIAEAKNTSKPRFLGWFVVRNRSPEEVAKRTSPHERDSEEEKIFSNPNLPWTSIRKDRRGVPALKEFLGSHFHNKIVKDLPRILQNARELRDGKAEEKKKLGPSRLTAEEQRWYLSKHAQDYTRILGVSQGGFYRRGTKSVPALQLGRNIERVCRGMRDKFKNHGHKRSFIDKKKNIWHAMDLQNVRLDQADERYDSELDSDYVSDKDPGDDQSENQGQRQNEDDESEEDGEQENGEGREQEEEEEEEEEEDEDIRRWIRERYRNTVGSSIPGAVSSQLVLHLYMEQIEKWGPIASDFVDDAAKVVLNFTKAVYEELQLDDTVKASLLRRIQEPKQVMETEAFQELKKLLEDETRVLSRTNPANNKLMEELRQSRELRRLELTGMVKKSNEENVEPEDVETYSHIDSEYKMVAEIHDVLYAYYNSALERFIENVTEIVIKRHLLGVNSIFNLFSVDMVHGLSDQDLAEIAGETPETRRTLDAQLSTLNETINTVEGLLEESRGSTADG